MTAPVEIEKVDLGAPGLLEFPFVRFSSWLRYLMDTNRFSQICGVKSLPDMMETLREFWVRFEKIHPTHQIFQRFRDGSVIPSLCLPVYSHTDEGRTYQKQGILVVSTHGALGRHLKQSGMGMNFTGRSLSTQFLFATMLRSAYSENEEIFNKLMGVYASDMHDLVEHGVWNSSRTCRLWCLHIGTKGDLPALVKCGLLQRSFRNVPKAPNSVSFCGGICHLCLAGRERPVHYPFEDLKASASCLATKFVEKPWPVPGLPLLLHNLPLEVGKEEAFFKPDLWHNWHAGVGKLWIGGCLVILSESCIPGSSVENKLGWLTHDWRTWCKNHRLAPFVTKIDRATLSYTTSKSWPEGHWSKGQATTHLMMYLQDLCARKVENQTDDPLLHSIVHGTKCMNLFLAELYVQGYWIPSPLARKIAALGFQFCETYERCASLCHERHQNRFPLHPKCHMLLHHAHQLMDDARCGDWAVNPLAESNQMQEDYIGRPSRISRRVAKRTIHLRALQRTILATYQALQKSDDDTRGL
ncbi:unnamed protein product [Durusdinium trenchii]|uniref:Uncharacterized protein n=2 Tax=Durusdinium trenchii TaxID=1381693 RepID=A0ABP0IF60_9DINO